MSRGVPWGPVGLRAKAIAAAVAELQRSVVLREVTMGIEPTTSDAVMR